MIPRYQRVVFWSLVASVFLMSLLLVRGCRRNQERVLSMRDQSAISAPNDIPNEQVSIAVANDSDDSITLDHISLALPEESSLRARLLLDRLFADFARPASTHPLPAGTAVTDVFLLDLPVSNAGPNSAFSSSTNPFGFSLNSPRQTERISPYGQPRSPGAQLAIVNLTKTFAETHPSGVEAEDLTLRSIIVTLHENFPEIEQVRFLVDGQSRDTLTGHADLTRPYAVTDPTKFVHALAADGSPI